MSGLRASLEPAIGLLLVWLALSRSISPGQVLAGIVVAVVALVVVPPRTGLRLRWVAVPGLVRDEVVAIARGVGGVLRETVTPGHPPAGIVTVHLPDGRLQEMSWLAAMLTLTPGTYVVGTDTQAKVLRVHVLDASDVTAITEDVLLLDRAVRAVFGLDPEHGLSVAVEERAP